MAPEPMEIVGGGIAKQTAQVMENVAAILEAAGASLGYVLKATVYLTDTDDFAAFNRTSAEYVSDPKPARSAAEVGELAIDAAVEIDCIAEA